MKLWLSFLIESQKQLMRHEPLVGVCHGAQPADLLSCIKLSLQCLKMRAIILVTEVLVLLFQMLFEILQLAVYLEVCLKILT